MLRTILSNRCSVLLACTLIFTGFLNGQWLTDPSTNNPICVATGGQYQPVAISDGSGGAIIAWQDGRHSGMSEIYVQKITRQGYVLWPEDGTSLSVSTGFKIDPVITTDGSGGAIVAWNEDRTNNNFYDVYAQRINADGQIEWGPEGVPISTSTSYQVNEEIVSDQAQGAIVTWLDYLNQSFFQVYAQRVNNAGQIQWPDNGVPVSSVPAELAVLPVSSHGAGRFIVGRIDPATRQAHLYAVGPDGQADPAWPDPEGARVSVSTTAEYDVIVADDNNNGAWAAWEQHSATATTTDIYFQLLNDGGKRLLGDTGTKVSMPLSDAALETISSALFGGSPNGRLTATPSSKVAATSSRGLFVVWADRRNSDMTGIDIYAQLYDTNGVAQWGDGGVPLTTKAGDQQNAVAASDGEGGLIVAWEDEGDIYAQRINSAGDIQWAVNGVPVSTAIDAQRFPAIVGSDSGAIITWEDGRVAPSSDIYASRVSSAATVNAVVEHSKTTLPTGYALGQNYPNPFNPTTVIEFSIPERTSVDLRLYDLLGNEVRVLIDKEMPAGNYKLSFDGRSLSSGTYFYRLTTDRFVQTRKLLLVK